MASIEITGVSNIPEPSSISVNHELIWSSSTGRNSSGTMVGKIVTTKKTYEVKWSFIPVTDVNNILNATDGDSEVPFSLTVLGTTIQAYRGDSSGERMPKIGTQASRYKEYTMNFIEW